MIKRIFELFLSNNQKNYNKTEYFLSKSTDHYDLDYRIKFLDRVK